MAYQRLDFQPGVDKENTSYSNEGKWNDSQLIRFRQGKPEKINGWQRKLDTVTLDGPTRFSRVWRALDDTIYLCYGTNTKMYIEAGGVIYDITPLRETQALVDAFDTSIGSNVVVVNDTAHGAGDGDYVTFSGATAVGGVPADDLNLEFQITLIDSDSYSITVNTTATSTATGGGASISAEYQINIGEADQLYAYGFGAGAFGASFWGTPRSSGNVTINPRTWTGGNWGEDLIFSPYGGAVYLWDATFPENRATEITQAPSKNNAVLITSDRHLVCFGCNDPANDASDNFGLEIAWCDQEDYTTWGANVTNTAGRYVLTGGTRILSAGAVEGQNIVFTDEDVYSMQYLGPPYTFGFQQVGTSSGIISPQAWIAYNGAVYWMGKNSFYEYNGSVRPMLNTIQSFVYQNLTQDQTKKVHTTLDRERHEISWFYPTQQVEATYLNGGIAIDADEILVATTAGFRDSGDLMIDDERITYTSKSDVKFLGCTRATAGTEAAVHLDKAVVYDPDGRQPLEPCRYVTYSITENVWWVGRLERTFMLDKGAIKNPIGTTRSGIVYEHDFGADADGAPLTTYIESADFDLGEGDSLMYVRRCVPDFTLTAGSVNLSIRTRYYAQSSQVRETIGNIVQGTDYINTRIRGRQMALRVESNDAGDDWKYGSPRIDIQPDGRR